MVPSSETTQAVWVTPSGVVKSYSGGAFTIAAIILSIASLER